MVKLGVDNDDSDDTNDNDDNDDSDDTDDAAGWPPILQGTQWFGREARISNSFCAKRAAHSVLARHGSGAPRPDRIFSRQWAPRPSRLWGAPLVSDSVGAGGGRVGCLSSAARISAYGVKADSCDAPSHTRGRLGSELHTDMVRLT